MGQILEFLSFELGSRLSHLIFAIPGEEPRELIVSEVISARIYGIGVEPLRQFRLRLPEAAGSSSPSRKNTV